MTLPAKERNHSSLKQPDIDGWYIYGAGEEVRCPGPALATSRFQGTCGRHMMTVESGLICVRIEGGARRHAIRVPTDRRHYPSFTKSCPHRAGCGSPLEIEARPTPTDHAA